MTVKSRFNENFNSCPECNSLNSIIYNEDRAEQTCHECGFVVKDRIFDTSIADERHFTREEANHRARTGPPISDHLSKLTLSTLIDKTNNREQDRIFRKNIWSSDNITNLHYALYQVHRICANLQLPYSIIRSSEKLTLKALDKGLAKGRTIIGIVVASIYHVCKGKNNLSLTEIVSQIEDSIYDKKKLRKRAHKCYTKMFQQLHLTSQTFNPLSYIPRFISDLGLDQKYIALTTKFFQMFSPYISMSGKDPKGIAAAAIYITCRTDNPFSQKKIAEIAGITDVTLRSRIKEFYAVYSK